MIMENTGEGRGQQLHSLSNITDKDLVLLLAGAKAGRNLVLAKMQVVLQVEGTEVTAANFAFLHEWALDLDKFITQLNQFANNAHRAEADSLINVPF